MRIAQFPLFISPLSFCIIGALALLAMSQRCAPSINRDNLNHEDGDDGNINDNGDNNVNGDNGNINNVNDNNNFLQQQRYDEALSIEGLSWDDITEEERDILMSLLLNRYINASMLPWNNDGIPVVVNVIRSALPRNYGQFIGYTGLLEL
ncbi:unnamed protein product [Brugia pahangi]|uniref:COesterase domain-containing protein n=1 Tax=Brugia pahangi TaxID=6280 RepID=A0A0N4T2Y7_BRUPA|nr:unnamed protein product [Brugia pahangi]